MIQPDGQYEMLDDATAQAMLAGRVMPDPGAILAMGAEADIAAIAARVKLGQRELDERAARRKAQRKSRNRNR